MSVPSATGRRPSTCSPVRQSSSLPFPGHRPVPEGLATNARALASRSVSTASPGPKPPSAAGHKAIEALHDRLATSDPSRHQERPALYSALLEHADRIQQVSLARMTSDLARRLNDNGRTVCSELVSLAVQALAKKDISEASYGAILSGVLAVLCEPHVSDYRVELFLGQVFAASGQAPACPQAMNLAMGELGRALKASAETSAYARRVADSCAAALAGDARAAFDATFGKAPAVAPGPLPLAADDSVQRDTRHNARPVDRQTPTFPPLPPADAAPAKTKAFFKAAIDHVRSHHSELPERPLRLPLMLAAERYGAQRLASEFLDVVMTHASKEHPASLTEVLQSLSDALDEPATRAEAATALVSSVVRHARKPGPEVEVQARLQTACEALRVLGGQMATSDLEHDAISRRDAALRALGQAGPVDTITAKLRNAFSAGYQHGAMPERAQAYERLAENGGVDEIAEPMEHLGMPTVCEEFLSLLLASDHRSQPKFVAAVWQLFECAGGTNMAEDTLSMVGPALLKCARDGLGAADGQDRPALAMTILGKVLATGKGNRRALDLASRALGWGPPDRALRARLRTALTEGFEQEKRSIRHG